MVRCRSLRLALAVGLLLLALTSAKPASDVGKSTDSKRLLVRFTPSVRAELAMSGSDSSAASIAAVGLLSSPSVLSGSARVLSSLGSGFVDTTNLEAAKAELLASSNVEAVADDEEVHALDFIPNDSLWGDLWGMRAINAPAAWDYETGSRDVVVAVIDTGVDYNHPDLRNNMWVNTAEIPNNGVDDDGNGFVDDVHGIDAFSNTGDPMDDQVGTWHGTHCAGTVGAEGNNNEGVAGVAHKVSIMALKFLGANGSGSTSGALVCLDYAVKHGARISSNSWGGGGSNSVFEAALSDAAANHNHLFIAAAGNDASDNDNNSNYPSNYVPTPDALIAVASTTSSNVLSGFSNFGATTVDLGAPGSSILSCSSSTSGSGYQYLSGTSMATPHVSGAAALLLAKNPTLTNMELKSLLMDNITPLTSLNGRMVKPGILNVQAALAAVPTPGLTCLHADGRLRVFWTQQGEKATCVSPDGVDLDMLQCAGEFTIRRLSNGLIATCDDPLPPLTELMCLESEGFIEVEWADEGESANCITEAGDILSGPLVCQASGMTTERFSSPEAALKAVCL